MSDKHLVLHGVAHVSNAEIYTPSQRYMRTDARFLAHLVATRANVADLRLKNRILPETGAAAYRLSQAKPPLGKPIFRAISA
jgi:hypothetical protein